MKTLRFLLSLTLFTSFFVLHSTCIVHAAEGDLAWAFGFGQNLEDIGYKVFVDSAGNVYMTGYFQGTVDFDPGAGIENLVSAGNNDIFITKMSSSGSLIWAKRIGGLSDEEGWGITVDASGNVITTGYFVGTVDFDPNGGGQNLNGGASGDIFISKLDSNGNYVGAWSMGGNIADWGFGVFVDPVGNIYTTGYFQNDLVFNPGNVSTGLTSAGGYDIFISKVTAAGSLDWVKRIGAANADVGLGISLYSSGNIYITGYFQGTVDFDSDATHAGNTDILTSAGGSDIFVLKLADDSSFAWAKRMGGVSLDEGQAVSVDISGNVYTTGLFNGTADFDPGPGVENLVNPGVGSDIFISKLDSSGNFVWAKSIGGIASADVGFGIFVQTSGSVYTTGYFGGTVDFDSDATHAGNTDILTSAGSEDIFISKLDSGGNYVWAKSMGGSSADSGYDIFVDSSGAVYTTGYFQNTDSDFDPGTGNHNLISAGLKDIFICKLSGRDAFPWNLFLPAILGNKKP